MASTFCPNDYTRNQIAEALKWAREDRDTLTTVASKVTNLESSLEGTDENVSSLQSSVATINSSINKISTNLEKQEDILKQIIYRGSDNKLQMDPANVTVDSVTGFSAALEKGILSVVKTSSSLIGDNPKITITGISVSAGQWYLGLGESYDSTILLNNPVMGILYDGSSVVAYTNNNGISDMFTVVEGYEIENGTLEIEVSKAFTSDGFTLTLYIAHESIDKEDALPYFQSILDLGVE